MRDKPTPKKLLTVIIVLLLGVTGATGYVLSTKYDQKDDKKPAATSQTKQKPAEKKTMPAAVQPVAYDGQDGKTALELLKTNATVETKDSSYGPYVDSINGVKGGTDGKYWAFYINGEMAQVGADAYQTKSGDKIEWKFE